MDSEMHRRWTPQAVQMREILERGRGQNGTRGRLGGGTDASTFPEMEKRGGAASRPLGEEEPPAFHDCKVPGGMSAPERPLDPAGVPSPRKKLRLFLEQSFLDNGRNRGHLILGLFG